MKRMAIIIMCITLVSKIFGFGREMALSYFYGTSFVSDAYFIASSMPKILLDFLGVGLTTAYIPMLSKIENQRGKEAGRIYTSNLIATALFFSFGIFLFSQLLAPFIVRVLAIGFDGEVFDLTVSFSRIMLFTVFVVGITSIFVGYLQIQENFLIPALIGLPLNIVVVLSIILSKRFGLYILVVGTVIAVYSQTFLMLPWVRWNDVKLSFKPYFKDPDIKETMRIALPVILGTSAGQINVLIDKTIASSIVIGGISALNYADRLNFFVQGLFVASMIAVMFPSLAKTSEKKNFDEMKKYVLECLDFINILLIPITVGALVFSDQIIQLLFGRGAFDAKAVELTSSVLFFYSIGMLGIGYKEILSKVFYAMHDAKTPVIISVVGVAINIVLNFILAHWMGLKGLALATSVSAIITSWLMLTQLRIKIGKFKFFDIDVIKIIFASCIMSVGAYKIYQVLLPCLDLMGALSIAFLIAMIIYGMVLLVLQVKSLDKTRLWLRSKIGR